MPTDDQNRHLLPLLGVAVCLMAAEVIEQERRQAVTEKDVTR